MNGDISNTHKEKKRSVLEKKKQSDLAKKRSALDKKKQSALDKSWRNGRCASLKISS